MPQNIKLRMDQPYGTIHPPHNGATIEQWGCYFNHAGDFLGFVDEDGQEKFDAATLAERRANRSANLSPSDPARAIGAPGLADESADMAARARDLDLREREAAIKERELNLKEREAAIAGGGKADPSGKPGKAGKAGKADKPAADDGKGAGDDDDTSGGRGNQTPAGDVDLKAWATGEKQYAFFALKKAATALYPDIITTNTRTLADGLVKAGFIGADDLKR